MSLKNIRRHKKYLFDLWSTIVGEHDSILSKYLISLYFIITSSSCECIRYKTKEDLILYI